MLKTVPPHDVHSQMLEGPGASPFKVKGVAYLGHLEYCDRFIPGGRERVLRALPESLQPFFEQGFLAGNWYDVFPLAAAGFVCAELVQLPFYEFIRQRSAVQAKEDIKGVYHFFFAIFSTKTVASKLPVLFSQYFNFGHISIIRAEKERVAVDRTEVPALIATWQNAVLQGYLEVVLQQAGAKTTTIEYGAFEPTGMNGLYEMVSIPTVLTWT